MFDGDANERAAPADAIDSSTSTKAGRPVQNSSLHPTGRSNRTVDEPSDDTSLRQRNPLTMKDDDDARCQNDSILSGL